MKSIALVGMLITMFIVVYLTITNLKTKPKLDALELAPGEAVPANLTELPAQVKNKLNEALEKGEAERKAAEEALK